MLRQFLAYVTTALEHRQPGVLRKRRVNLRELA
jgi:hypothetical protein